MKRDPVPERVLFVLTALGLVLPITLAVVLGLAAVLPAMGDVPASLVLKWIGLGLGVLWTVDLVCLVLAQAVSRLAHEEEDDQGPS